MKFDNKIMSDINDVFYLWLLTKKGNTNGN